MERSFNVAQVSFTSRARTRANLGDDPEAGVGHGDVLEVVVILANEGFVGVVEFDDAAPGEAVDCRRYLLAGRDEEFLRVTGDVSDEGERRPRVDPWNG